jgi:calmodulin
MDFDEFLQMMIAKTKDSVDEKELQKQVKAAFKMFDVDGNGKIDVVELQTGMDKLGEHLTQDQAQDMMLEADKDGDGFIDEEEFAATIFQF